MATKVLPRWTVQRTCGSRRLVDQPHSHTHTALCAQQTAANRSQGGKNRRRGKNENDNEKRELVFKEEGQEYAQVVKMLGNGRLEAQCFDGARRLAHIRGKLRKKVWINQGDIILLSLRDYQDEKGDVIMKYSGKLSQLNCY